MDKKKKVPPSPDARAKSKSSPKKSKEAKARRAKAAVAIQRWFHGWKQRHYMNVSRKWALRKRLTFQDFLQQYREHLIEIMKRHGNVEPEVYIDFIDVNDYAERVSRFEIAFSKVLPADRQGLKYKELRGYFKALKLHPSDKEINDAAKMIIPDCWSVSEYDFSKEEVVEISLHIYVPKGTKMDVRKSTWLNPIIDGHEAMMLTLPEQTKGKSSFEKAFNIVRESNSERNAEIEGAAESNEGDTASSATTSTSVVKKKD